ncbi:MAG: peptidase S24 [Dermatophilaceae bacterium]
MREPIRLGLARVRGTSMLPTLRDGDRLLVAYGLRPRPGRLVLCQLPPDTDGVPRPLAVKRLIGPAPGPRAPYGVRWGSSAQDRGWWVERDNPAEGVDSWLVGALPDDAIRAAVLARLPRRPGLLRYAGRHERE